MSYSLEDDDAKAFYVSTIDSLGFIYLNASLDYDVKKIYNFTVRAREKLTSESFNDTARVVLEVTEVLANENNPKFNKTSYIVNVTEGVSPGKVIQVAATDADQEKFGTIKYSIVDGTDAMFVIDNQTGWINTTAPLDRETKDSYILIVRASDDGAFPRHTDVLVVVTVLDSNEHSPMFLASNYSGSVVENSNVGNVILAVEAEDLDKGSNALFKFSVHGGDGKFSVVSDGNLGYVTVNGSLDYETHKNYTFLVIARETSTSEKRESNVSVTVSLIDVNDNSPIFSPVSGYTVNAAENSVNGSFVLNVSASDADSGSYGQVTYSLTTSSVPFSIDSNTGEITVQGNLDRETKDSYAVTVQAKDAGKPSLMSYVHVAVNITDVNDQTPMFSQDTYMVEIVENTEIGTSILSVSATDEDQGSNSDLSYYIEGADGLFKVDSNGVISVNGSLDYESNTTFSFKVFAQESSTSERWKANCTVNVTLSDVNEYDPKFTRVSYFASVKENIPAGHKVITVAATDKDRFFKIISYHILSGNDAGFFTLNYTSGVVTTTGPIDKEATNDNFVLKIQASDNGSPNRTTETFVVIEIVDENDHSPIFSKSWYNATIPESLPVGTTIFTVKATDLDKNATNSDVRYYISGSDGRFDVDATTGQVFVNSTLDYETNKTFMFTIFAEETATLAKRQHNATVFITLTDTNEYDPVFTPPRFRGNVSETSAIGTSVLQIKASDQDGKYKEISYSILPSTDSGSFSINNTTGLIVTAVELDRESQDVFILTVQAKDNGAPGRTAEVTVIIDVLDVNDNEPEFSQKRYNATVPENLPIGTSLLTVTAEDQDMGENAKFSYHIVGGDDKFDISADDGVIVTKAKLDYERKTSYTFLVIANETNSSLESNPNATITIVIQDVNEFNPVFSQQQYAANVSENSTAGTPVIKVTATDADGYYKHVSYSIISGDNANFKINSTTGEIFTNATLDREMKAQFILTVRAKDNGVNHSRTAEAVVVISILDVSDHGPKFLQRSYNASIFENIAVDTRVLTVEATDLDLGSNAVIDYSVINGDGTFRVDSSGNIQLNKSLDFETKMKYEFQVIASEPQTASGFTDTTNVAIFVQDVNEYNPVFSPSSYIAVVNDSRSVGTRVIQVSATDADGSDDNITFSIEHGNVGSAFVINSTSGWIETAIVLDANDLEEYILTVRARDGGDFPRTAEVLVVINVNETKRNASFLLQDVYNVTVLENILVNSVVVKLELRYSRNAITSVFSFSIHGGNSDFGVTQKGEVTVANTLNYENKSSYNFTVVVTEIKPASGLVANATINIKVKDVNEFNPQFGEKMYRANVSEDVTPGTYVTKVSATDRDGDFNVISYTIVHGNQGNNFTINSTTGMITTATPLDRETLTQFVLTVQASDDGASPRTSEVVVIVDILDISEHPPVFLMANYSAEVYENAAVGTTVLVVGTSDKDTTPSSVAYFLDGADWKFGVTSGGEIYVNGSLDFERNDSYTFTVIAQEAAPYSHLQHNATVTIKLKDVNEFNPEFNQTVYSGSVKESDVMGTTVLRVFASDKDKELNILTYSIVGGNDLGNFSINGTTGEITLAKPVDREKKHQIVLTVRAEDDGAPPRTGEVPVVVGIIDANDEGPVFSMSQYNANVSEDAVVGTTVLAVQAVDLDATPDMLEYKIVGENAFKAETHYGLGFLVVNQELDFEAKQAYSFLVYAVEKTTEKRNTSVSVNITVLDANDNRPVFVNLSYSGEVLEGASPGTIVVNVSADDADSEEFGPLFYSIIDGDPAGNFKMSNLTGRISTRRVLDREAQQEYALVVEVRDSGSPALTSTAVVAITVLDSNDVTPKFLGTPYSASVPENSKMNTTILTVQAVDHDKGQNGVIMYSLVGGNGLFSVNQDGHIMVAGSLDYEKNKTFAFYVFANEIQTSEKRQANASVVITITDVNDNSPEFSKNIYEFSVGESPSFPVPVGTVSAPDEDSGGFGEVMYFIVHGDMNGNFTINNKTGAVETGAVLNREVKDRYVLTIQAVDGGSPPRKAVATIIVTVTDQNEQPPYFENTPYRAEIVENKEYSDSPVFKVTAKDPDLMSITYSLVNQSGFSIGPTSGIISATGSFDREKQGVYNLTVNATDQGGLSAVEHVIINVEDTNDNTPQFLGTPYQTNIPDNTSTGVHILTVQASDLDEAHNAEIIFSLLGAEGKFTVNQTTGLISVSGKLDSQEKSLYNLEVIATDRGIPQARSNSTSVVVNLTDYSNHPPEFAKVAFVGEILEGLGTTFVLDVEASDPDSGLLGKITYSITGGNAGNAFSINSTGAILSTKALDFENDTQKAFDLTVTVTDSGGLTDTTQVRITVVDANDNAPQIINLPSPSEFNISDNIPPGTLLYVLRAEDLDSGNNGDLEYNGTALPNNLTIEQATGLITARTKLESTSASSILFTAWVKDKGNPSLSSPNYTIKFNIISDPVSDPFFLRTLTETTVFENASVNDFVVKVNASASADNFTILFQLPSGGYFKINNEGNISLARPMNRETLDGFSLLVQASKAGKQAIGYVSITIADVNDETPEFPFKVYKGQVNENSPAGSPVLQVKAVDGDKEDTISYGIASGNTGGIFNISSPGGIQIALPPDHENTSFFNLTVVASDGVNVGKTFVEITIVDINDNYPVFNSSYSISLPEDTLGGATVLQVSAKDADDDDIVQYSMSGDEGRFTIDSLTGVISTTDKHLDFEETTSYTLNVTGSDRGGLKASVLVGVNITDSNDHAPVFSHTSYNVTIEENYVGALPLNINATDADSGSNGNVTYSIVGGSSQFSINLTTGVLNVTSPIDRDGSGVTNDKFCRGVFILTIQASDNGNPKLSDTATVTVRVTDINDNAPTFSRSSYEVVISVLDTGNVLRVVASDADCTTNSDIQYSFTSVNGSSLFEMNATLGNISIVKPLNGSQGVYFLNVTASNEQATPKLQSSVMVTVTVIESKNYPPVFDSNKYTFNVSEGADIGVAIGKVSATDVNQGKDGVFIYSIENPGYVIPFDIEPKTGVIALVREIDRESQMNYTLIVVAQDFGEPPLRQTADVFISVDDVNDIVPKFEQDLQRFNVSENITVGSLVCTVTAVDQDGELYGQPVYIIYSGNEAGHFRIENSTGAIYLVKKLDREVVNRFELIIHAYNHGSTIARKRRDTGENFDVLKVVIEVTDINDNDPQFETAKYIAGFKLSDPTGTNITQIRATDKDEGSNADIIYSIHEGNEAGAFAIDPKTGVITTTANIARLNESKVILTVLARDSPDKPLESAQSAVVTIYKLPEDNPLDLTVSSDLDEDTIRELLQNITGPGYDIIIQGITPDGLLSNVKYYVIKNDVFLTQEQMTNLILAYCEANEEICKRFGINYASQGGNTNALLGEDDMTILEAMLLTLGVIVGIGGLLGILLLCCLRRSRKRYMPVYEPNDLILPSKAVSFDERPHYYQPNSADDPNRESQEVEIHMDEEHSSVESAEEARAGSTSSTDIENNEAIAKVQAYMNQALMDDDTDSDTDSSEDPDREPSASVWVGGGSSGSSEQLVSKYTITNL